MAESFRHEFGHPTLQDPELAEWWARAAGFRRGGVDRLLEPAPWTRTIDELCSDGVHGEVYAHELVRVPAGTSWGFLDLVADDGREVMGKFGWELAGAWSTAMAGEREVILLWTIESWEAWAEFEGAQRADPVVRGWNEQVRERSDGVEPDPARRRTALPVSHRPPAAGVRSRQLSAARRPPVESHIIFVTADDVEVAP